MDGRERTGCCGCGRIAGSFKDGPMNERDLPGVICAAEALTAILCSCLSMRSLWSFPSTHFCSKFGSFSARAFKLSVWGFLPWFLHLPPFSFLFSSLVFFDVCPAHLVLTAYGILAARSTSILHHRIWQSMSWQMTKGVDASLRICL